MSSKKSSSASTGSISTATTTSSTASPVSIKDSLIDNKEKLNDLNDQILNSQQIQRPHHHHHHNHVVVQRSNSNCVDRQSSMGSHDFRNNFNPSYQKTESIMSSDSDIRFTRKKLGDNQRCGCIIIAGFLVMLLVAGLILCKWFLRVCFRLKIMYLNFLIILLVTDAGCEYLLSFFLLKYELLYLKINFWFMMSFLLYGRHYEEEI